MTDDQIWWLEFIGALQFSWLISFILVIIWINNVRSEVRHLKEKIPSIWR